MASFVSVFQTTRSRNAYDFVGNVRDMPFEESHPLDELQFDKLEYTANLYFREYNKENGALVKEAILCTK